MCMLVALNVLNLLHLSIPVNECESNTIWTKLKKKSRSVHFFITLYQLVVEKNYVSGYFFIWNDE